MCLYTKQLYPKEATKDIVVYKRLNKYGKNKLISPYKGKFYQLDTEYCSKLAYENFNRAYAREKEIFGIVEKGLHSYTNKKEAFSEKCSREVISKGIIPKGSKYYKGKWSEIASDRLILLEIIS